jgi:hypothetical protein
MFDVAQDRLSYSELLQPEIGYNMDFAVGLTYSLDLEALLGVPVALGLLDDMDTPLMDNPFYILEAIRRSSDKIAIFCSGGCICLPRKIQSVYSLLENSVFEVKLDRKRSFHPKLWLIKYSNDAGKSYVKLIVLSRNLTFDSSLDEAFETSGYIGDGVNEKNRPLYDMLQFAAKFCGGAKRESVLSLANDILRVSSFEIGDPFDSYEFLPLGIDGYKRDETGLCDDKSDMLVISPFLSDDIVKELTENTSAPKLLITRKSSVNQKVLDSFDDVYVVRDALLNNELGVKQDVHAKLYFTSCYTQSDSRHYLYLGSANASHNAFYSNVEFLIKLRYAPYKISFDKFKRELMPEENNIFERINKAPVLSQDEEEDAFDKALKEAVWAIKSAEIIKNESKYDINIHCKKMEIDKRVRIAPMQKPNAFVDLIDGAVLKGLLLKELSEFYVLESGGKKIVVKIRTHNMPPDRDDAIYKSIIVSKNAFLSYVLFMLSDDCVQSAYEQSEYAKILEGGYRQDEGNGAFAHVAVYERMLEAAYENPSRLGGIADVMAKLDDSIVDDGFKAMYEKFRTAVRRNKR